MLLLQVVIVTVTLLSQTALGQRMCDARRPCSVSGIYMQWASLLRACSHSYLFSIATQIHEGDITILVSQNGRVKRGATSIRGLLWANAVVPYTINNSFSGERWKNNTCTEVWYSYLSLSTAIFSSHSCTADERRVILESMSHWENTTCIRFRARTNQSNYVNFFPGGG